MPFLDLFKNFRKDDDKKVESKIPTPNNKQETPEIQDQKQNLINSVLEINSKAKKR